jgi:hypothetical protein
MNRALRPDDDLPDAERDARKAGRAGSAVGALAGSAGAVAAVRMLGFPGLSAAGISSGLATIGASVGGGMAAGTMIAVAAPAAAAAGLGYLIYRLALWLASGTSTPAWPEPS